MRRNESEPVPPDSFASITSSTNCILVPILDSGNAHRRHTLALALAAGTGLQLRIINPVVIPTGVSHDHPPIESDENRQTAKDALRANKHHKFDVSVVGSIRFGRNAEKIIATAVDDFDAALVDLEASLLPADEFRADVIEKIVQTVSCDVVVTNASGTFDDLVSVLVPVAGGPHSGLAVDIAKVLAQAYGAWLDVIHVHDQDTTVDDRKQAETYLDAALARLTDYERVDVRTFDADDVTSELIEQATRYDATVLGAPQKGRLRRYAFSSTTDDIADTADAPVLTAWHRGEGEHWWSHN